MDTTLTRPQATFLIDPKNDFAFKRIFGNSEHPNTLLDLSNAILEANNEEPIKSITVLNPQLDPTVLGDKSAVLDIKAKADRGEIINIEMQFVNPYHWQQRILYYWSKLYQEQLKKGENYTKLKKTLSFSILNFELLKGSRSHALYELRNRYDNERLTDQLQLYFVELPKVFRNPPPAHLGEWCRFLHAPSADELRQLACHNPAINEAYTMLSRMSQNPNERELYEMRQKSIMDYSSNMEGARAEGRAEGRVEGKAEGQKQGRHDLLIEMAEAKFGPLPENVLEYLNQANEARLKTLSMSLLEADDLESWLS